MLFSIQKFDAPKGHEALYGNNPYSIEASYDLELDKKEVVVVQWSIETGGVSIDEGVKIVSGTTPFQMDTIVDVGAAKSGAPVCLKYRIFTVESSEGPQIELANFDVKVPSKGKVELDLPAPLTGTLETQPGGYASCKIEVSSEVSGDWCAATIITDNTGNSASTAEIAEDGSATLRVGIAGKPKTVNGEVIVLGANPWTEVPAVL